MKPWIGVCVLFTPFSGMSYGQTVGASVQGIIRLLKDRSTDDMHWTRQMVLLFDNSGFAQKWV
jgi:general stress protein 26